MALAREATSPLGDRAFERAWPDGAQRARCLGSLLDDGLLVRETGGYTLP